MTVEVKDSVRLSGQNQSPPWPWTVNNIIYPDDKDSDFRGFHLRELEHLSSRLLTVGTMERDTFRAKEFPFIKLHVNDVHIIKKHKPLPVPKGTPEWMIETLKGRDDWLPRGYMSSGYGFCSTEQHTMYKKDAISWATFCQDDMRFWGPGLSSLRVGTTCFGGLSMRARRVWENNPECKFVVVKYWKKMNLSPKSLTQAKSILNEEQHIKYLTHLIDMGLMPKHNDPAEVYKLGWWSADMSKISRDLLHMYYSSARNVNEFPGIVRAFLSMMDYDLDPYIAFVLAYYMQQEYGAGHGLLRLAELKGSRKSTPLEVRYVDHESEHRILRDGVINLAIRQAYQLYAFMRHTSMQGTVMTEAKKRLEPAVQNRMANISIPKDLHDTEDVTLNIKEIANV